MAGAKHYGERVNVIKSVRVDGRWRFITTIPTRGYRFAARAEGLLVVPAPSYTARVMLAVLPFENMSGQKSQEYFSDGLTEEMITQLGRINPDRLGVIARTSAMKYKNSTKSVHEIGRELDVSHILEGSVRRARGRRGDRAVSAGSRNRAKVC